MATQPVFHREAFTAMGSPCEVQLFARSEAEAAEASAAVVTEVARLEAKYSRYRETSFLSEINRAAAAGAAIEVDPETAQLLNYAAACRDQSDGLFDVTSGILRRAWRFDRHEPPDGATVAALLDRVGWPKVSWQPPVLSFAVKGMEIDFGGIVKEYAVDCAASTLRSAGIESAVVNLGGDLVVVGPRPGNAPWSVGIRHPRDPKGVLRTLQLRQGALATSGDYERCIVFQGQRYGHVLNPHTGWPVRHMASVSVLAKLCVVAGSASTIAVLKEEVGAAWLTGLGLPHLWVATSGETGGPLA